MTNVAQGQFNKARETREAVLSAAAKMFREKGYAAVSLRVIAKTAGLTTGSLYYHFKSKEDVVGEVLEQGHIHVRLALEAALKNAGFGSDHAAILRLAMRTHMECLFGDDSLPAANIRIFSQVPPEVKAKSLASRFAYEELWREILTNAQADGLLKPGLDVELVMPLMFGAINWTLEWSDSTESSVNAIVDQVLSMLMATPRS